MADFKDRLKEIRQAKELSQQELADRIGVHVMTISGYERGIRRPDFDVLDSLADALDTSFDYLLGNADINSGYPRHGYDASQMRRVSIYAKKILQAYNDASPDTQAAVRAILHVQEEPDGDR